MISKKERWLMFNKISKSYDLINRFITFGLDIKWRKEVINKLPKQCENVLDIASGTMDVAIQMTESRPDIKNIIALDMAKDMLSIGSDKCNKKSIIKIKPVISDVHNMPYSNEAFCAATVAFGIRNFENLPKAFKEIYRVLKSDSSFIILESCQPKNKILAFFNNIYLRIWVRSIGHLISGNKDSYSYLAKSIKSFYTPDQLKTILLKTGFKQVDIQTHMLESIQIIHAKK